MSYYKMNANKENIESTIQRNKPNKLNIKIENVKQLIDQTCKNEFISHWKNHAPTFGWCKMNYPNYIQPSLTNKYETQRKLLVKDLENRLEKEKIENEIEQDLHSNKKQHIGKKNYRINPSIINNDILDEIKNLVNPTSNPSETFCNKLNSKEKYYKSIFQTISQQKAHLVINDNNLYNASTLTKLNNKLLNELGYKNSIAILTTNTMNKKILCIDTKYHFDIKYSSIFPKSIFISERDTNDYSKPLKKIGDISFEEEIYENEGIKRLKRVSCDNLTDESLKLFLNEKVKKLNIENNYWISQDVITKIGQLSNNIVELNIRNLNLNSNSLLKLLNFLLNLKSLDISDCKFLDETAPIHLKNKGLNLKCLNLSGLINSINDSNISLIAEIQTLEKLNISRCNNITSVGLSQFHKIMKANVFKSLNFSSLRNIGSDEINLIIKNCLNSLEDINLSLLPQKSINKAAIASISLCTKIENINLSGSINIDDLSALKNLKLNSLNVSSLQCVDNDFAISVVNSKIKVLRMSNCLALTNNLLEYIYKYDKLSLILLEINRTPLITNDLIDKCKLKHYPNFYIIRSTNIVWNVENIGLKIPLIPKVFEKPFIKGIKKPANKKKVNEKNPVFLYEKFIAENKPKTIFDFNI